MQGFYRLVLYYDRDNVVRIEELCDFTLVCCELQGQNVIPNILMIHEQKKDYWLQIEMYVLERLKV